MALALPELRRGSSAEANLDLVLDVADVEAVARGSRAIDVQLDLRYIAGAVDERASDAGDRVDLRQNLLRLRGASRRHRRTA